MATNTTTQATLDVSDDEQTDDHEDCACQTGVADLCDFEHFEVDA